MKTFVQILKRNNISFGGFLAGYLLIALISAGAMIATQLVRGQVTDTVAIGDFNAMVGLLWLLSALTAVRAISSAVTVYLRRWFAAKAGYHMRGNFASAFVRVPFSQVAKANSGEVQSIFAEDIVVTMSHLLMAGLDMLADMMLLILTVIYLFMLHSGYATIFFVSFPVLIVLQVLVSVPIQKKSKRMSETQADYTAVVSDSFQNTATIVAYGLEDYVMNRAAQSYDKALAALKSFIGTLSLLVPMGMLFTITPYLIVNVIVGQSVIEGTLDFAEFIAFLLIASNAVSWLAMFSQNVTAFQRGVATAKRVMETTPTQGNQPTLSTTYQTPTDASVAVQLSNVSFTYEQAPEITENPDNTEENTAPSTVLHAIDLSICKGEKVALVGESGSGKSTLVKLILGLYPPTTGTVSVANNTDSLAYVPQDSFLFPATIRENITGKDQLSPDEEARMMQACRDTQSLEFITDKPNGFDELLHEGAENLSGGQKQRLAMARALYTGSDIIVFDEATAALDPTTEAEILATLEGIGQDKTIIMVTHRASTASFCERVITLKEGGISHD